MIHDKPPNLQVPDFAKPYLDRVSLDISPDDGMYAKNFGHYLTCGASALHVIKSVLELAEIETPRRVLDFGAGAGRVTRWLRVAFPDAEIDACDTREADVTFCRESLGVNTWISGTDIDSLRPPNTYDLTWAGSVLTHLRADDTMRLLRRFIDWTNPGGLVVATTHGRRAVEFAETGRIGYIDAERWQQVLDGYRTSGYGYADYVDWPDYGVSLTALSWTTNLVERWPDVRLVALGEHAWDGHQDVLAVQRPA